MAELEALLQQEIPNGRKALLDGKVNLENVANYCQQLYVDSENKKMALDETKNYTTQSLASVAYQINTLANNMLHMLDIQATELASMESSINHISMTVDVHKEKVARREIGLLTTNKTVTRHHQIVGPTVPDRAVKYVRKPIDYTELDDIGHGVKIANQQSGQGSLAVRRPSKTPSPSVDGRKRDSLKSVTSSTGYGTIRAVRTPTVPTDYNSTKRLPSMYSSRARTNSNSSSGSGSISSSSGYYPGPGVSAGSLPPPPLQGPPPPPSVPSAMPPPPMDSHHSMPPPPPMTEPPPPLPPMAPPAPMPPPTSMPPPPVPSSQDDDMPPPPGGMMPPPPDDFPTPYNNHDDSSSTAGSNYGSSDPAWAPKEYIQKVIAIYDYSAENADELTLREDEIVYVVKKNDDGWFEGVSNGVTGLFPGNYVETISV